MEEEVVRLCTAAWPACSWSKSKEKMDFTHSLSCSPSPSHYRSSSVIQICILWFVFSFSSCRSYLDMAKVLVFRHFFWFVLSVVFITGSTRISVFGLGYLLACFFFLLFGTQLLGKPSRTRLNLWDCLIIYNVAVIISKNLLSVSITSIVWWWNIFYVYIHN